MKKYISIILICFLGANLLVGCGKKKKVAPTLEDYAGLYTCLGYYAEEQFIVQEDLSKWSVNLKRDGPGADFDKLNMTTIDLFLDDEPADKETDLTVESVCDIYYPFAKIRDGYCIAMPEGLEEGRFILSEDGTAQSPFGDKLSEYTWVMDGNSITFKNKSSGEIIYTGTIADGILTLDVIYTNPDGSTFTTQDILVTKDVDTSNIDTISIEEYNALPKEQKNG